MKGYLKCFFDVLYFYLNEQHIRLNMQIAILELRMVIQKSVMLPHIVTAKTFQIASLTEIYHSIVLE
jgi:hypothetical protein